MQNRIRRFVAALATAALVLTLAVPAAANNRAYQVDTEPATVPMIFDVLVMRPVGLAMTVVGTVAYVFPVAPIMAVTRPGDLGKPLGPLVGAPARFTFADPIGQHP
ncbi:MAG: hypothetical protein AAF430_22670 [Myxococcota bacterium]